ncbi:MAG: tetratricopeptide repeat protein [Sedimentisphaerales bacterium]|nr:tetratricopeptide repeat protein [Sedimentisphaerales bacterium]
MLKKCRIAVIVCAAVVLMTGGCETNSQNKKTASARWEKMSSQMKLPLAQQQFDNGKYADAAKTIGECLKADPNMPQARLLVGKILFVQGQVAQGTKEMEKAVELNQKLDDGWYWLGLAADEKSQTDKAYEYYKKAMDINGGNIDYILALARALGALNKTDEAIAMLNDKMRLFPSDVELKAKCADLLCRKPNYDEAIALYRQASMLAPQRVDIAESFGYCCIQAGKWSDASEVFTKLAASCTDENKKTVYLQFLGMCQINAGQYGRAVTSYSKLNAKERDSAQVWLRMGQAALGAGDAERAYTCSKRALEIQPDFTDAIAIKGSAEYLKKEYAEAVKSFEQVVRDPKQESFAWTMLSKCYEHLGDSEKAKQAAEKARVLSERSDVSDLLAKIDE